MRPEDVEAFFKVGLKREKLALTNRGKLLAKLAKQMESDKSLVKIVAFAHQALESEERAYLWLVRNHGLLKGRSPVQAILDGDSALVMQLLANIEYGMPV
ncbi:MAG: antitoxin Xre/MbcA/ParS toxin-binding domain-containing protein [Burkholderiales bacterium]|nr:antitoxin Xre/MbcA/ParS toxin-binding domain-containing protein [Burkholderiales bacterium]